MILDPLAVEDGWERLGSIREQVDAFALDARASGDLDWAERARKVQVQVELCLNRGARLRAQVRLVEGLAND